MAPLRRYLRITKYSVLECRIYVDNPSLVQSWLLHPRDPVLPRVIESVRPLVLPKLMEERERARKKGAKKKGAIRDVLVEEDFEVSLFLTETNTRHSLLYKHRRARDKTQTRLVSNSSKLTGAARDAPIDVDDGSGDGGVAGLRVELGEEEQDVANDADGDADVVLTAAATGLTGTTAATRASDPQPPNLLRDDSDEETPIALRDIPDIRELQQQASESEAQGARRSKRRRREVVNLDESDEDDAGVHDEDSNDDSLFASNDEGDVEDGLGARPPAKRSRFAAADLELGGAEDEENRKKKKLAMDVIYEGFAIYGRVLCLVVKQRGPQRTRTIQSMLSSPQRRAGAVSAAAGSGAYSGGAGTAAPPKPGGQAAMENWIASTQLPPGATEEDMP